MYMGLGDLGTNGMGIPVPNPKPSIPKGGISSPGRTKRI